MVAPAFGFSAGDFIAVIALISKVSKALRETEGAASQYQYAAVELDLIHSVLIKVQSLEPSTQNEDLVQKIRLCSATCHTPLSRFVAKIRKFEGHLGASRSSKPVRVVKGVKRNVRKIQWAVTVEKELSKLKASIGPVLQAIEVLLQLESLERIDDISRATKHSFDCAQKTLVSVDDLKSSLWSKVATKDQLAEIPMLINDLSVQRSTKDDKLFEITTSTQANVQELKTRLVMHEHFLTTMAYRLNIPMDGESSSCMIPAGTGMLLDESRLKAAEPDAPQNVQLAIMLLAIRKGITELIILLLCLLPTVQRFLRIAFTSIAMAPTLLLSDNIHIEDALGRSLSLPYQHFRSWSTLQSRLVESFIGHPGEMKVKNNEFHMANLLTRGEFALTQTKWERAIFPGAKLAMSMQLKDRHLPQTCPRCSIRDLEASVDTWKTCTVCSLTYRVLAETPKLKAEPSSLPSRKKRTIEREIYPTDLDPTDLDPTIAFFEMEVFKRIHLVGHILGTNQTAFRQVAEEIMSSTRSRVPRHALTPPGEENDSRMKGNPGSMHTALNWDTHSVQPTVKSVPPEDEVDDVAEASNKENETLGGERLEEQVGATMRYLESTTMTRNRKLIQGRGSKEPNGLAGDNENTSSSDEDNSLLSPDNRLPRLLRQDYIHDTEGRPRTNQFARQPVGDSAWWMYGRNKRGSRGASDIGYVSGSDGVTSALSGEFSTMRSRESRIPTQESDPTGRARAYDWESTTTPGQAAAALASLRESNTSRDDHSRDMLLEGNMDLPIWSHSRSRSRTSSMTPEDVRPDGYELKLGVLLDGRRDSGERSVSEAPHHVESNAP